MTIIILSIAMLLAVGVWLLVVGLRGRSVDDHPVCRGCRQDLFGTDPQNDRCPECGVAIKLATGQGIRIGNRCRRTRWVVAGALLMVVSLGLLGAGGYAIVKPVDVYRWYPMSVLLSRIDSGQSGPRALKEVQRRLGSPNVTLGTRQQVVRQLLKFQGDLNVIWNKTWGDILIGEIIASRMTPAQQQRFFEQVSQTEYTVRPKVRAGSMIVVKTKHSFRGRSHPCWWIDACSYGGHATCYGPYPANHDLIVGCLCSRFVFINSHA